MSHWCNKKLIHLQASVAKGEMKAPPDWRQQRKKVIERDGKMCRYCGGKYEKYLYRSHRDHDHGNHKLKNLVLSCKLCYMIRQLGPYHLRELVLCSSQLSQREIVRRVVDHYLKTAEILSVIEIDPQAKKAPISLVEFIALLEEQIPIGPLEENLKLFPTKYLETTFMDVCASASSESFLKQKDDNYLIEMESEDEDYDYYLKFQDETAELQDYEMTVDEQKYVELYFKNDETRIRNKSCLIKECEEFLQQARDEVLLQEIDDKEFKKRHKKVRKNKKNLIDKMKKG